MKTMRRARWAIVMAGAAVGVGLLSACNPISQKPYIPPGPTWSTAKLVYDGPADAWIEVGLSGIGGYRVETQTSVWVPDEDESPRDCKSATDRTVVVTCVWGYPGMPANEFRRADQDAPGTYWPAILVHSGEQFEVRVHCWQNDTKARCPEGTKVEARAVDGEGRLIGDLRGIT